MCKSKVEGGQRCAGHALTRMNAMIAAGEESVARYERGEITKEEAQAHHAKVHDAMVDYASTLDGAADYRADAAEAQALADQTRDPEDEFIAAHLRGLVDEGAQRAQVNREVENAYRASQGQPPLATPVPQTFAQEAEAQAAAEKAAAAKAAKDADPFGLRAAEARPVDNYITPENGHGFGNPDDQYRLSAGLGISAEELQRISDDALETSGYGQALREAGLLAPKAATASGGGRGFSAEVQFDAPRGLPTRPPATTGEWTFDGSAPSIPAQVVTATSMVNATEERRHVQAATLNDQPTVRPGDPAATRAIAAMGPPQPRGEGFRGRREERVKRQGYRDIAASKFGTEYLEAVQKYQGRYDEKQIARVATALARHYTDTNPEPFHDANGIVHTVEQMGQRFACANLDTTLAAATRGS